MRIALVVGAVAYLWCLAAHADDIRITLNKAFVEKFKDAATITETCHVDKALAAPHAQKDDGDLHIAARCAESQLPAVIEIKNARKESGAVNFAQKAAQAHEELLVHGVWRLWVEHANSTAQTQGQGVSVPFDTTNPSHVYEIHPIIKIGDQDVSAGIGVIPGFDGKPAADSVAAYERTRCELTDQGDQIGLRTTMVGFNHPKLAVQLREDPTRNSADDGWHVFAELLDENGDLLARKRHLILVDGTSAAQRLSAAHKGDNFLVMAMPRIDLALVSWRIRYASCTAVQVNGELVHSATSECAAMGRFSFKPDDVLRWDLPYELVVIAVFKKQPSVEDSENDPNP
jgi:hypothetical protein